VIIVKTFARKKLTENISVSPFPTKSCVSKLVKKWRAKGSVYDIKKAIEQDCAD
jgi:hypothetical protein